ncbi:S41 family peptidase [Sphingomicrobium aestuariivivum]|uniref:S41 family peptidase n=1 Tax=Sphingomicrobium aestuariivivum TaxID=1582356 RepID=UPI001FD6CC98|nr:S41 family peptidase [Sphingomicrobium aestuariivivum]MCJ8189902.1 S41 family peptidase [Sphingomicrobium aestuariivivum]
MRSKLLALALLAGTSTLVLPATAQDETAECTAESCYSAEAVRADITELYAVLQARHPNLYARTDKAQYDMFVEGLIDDVTGPMPKAEAHFMFQQLLAKARTATTFTSAHMEDLFAALAGGGKLFPLNVRFDGMKMVLKSHAAEDDSLPPGTEIVAINDIETNWLGMYFDPFVSAENNDVIRAQLANGLPMYLPFLLEGAETLQLTVDRDGTNETVTVAAVDMATFEAITAARGDEAPEADKPEKLFVDDSGIAYFRPSFAPNEGAVSDAFATINAAGASDLLIDLRDSLGGDLDRFAPVLAHIAGAPFVMTGAVSERLEDGTLAEQGATTFQPVEGGFGGTVWILVDESTRGETVRVAAAAQDQRLATILGRPTVDLASGFAGKARHTLANSGVKFSMPTRYMLRASGDDTGEGVTPDMGLSGDDLLEAAMRHIGFEKDAR